MTTTEVMRQRWWSWGSAAPWRRRVVGSPVAPGDPVGHLGETGDTLGVETVGLQRGDGGVHVGADPRLHGVHDAAGPQRVLQEDHVGWAQPRGADPLQQVP